MLACSLLTFSSPKYPSPLLPWTFPSVCIFLSLYPPLSPALCLVDLTTKCHGRWLGSLKGTRRHWWSGQATLPLTVRRNVWVFGALPNSVSVLDIHASPDRAADWATIRSRDFRMQAPPLTLGSSCCQNVSHIKGQAMTLCNILWVWALISVSHTVWLCMTLLRWGKSLRGTWSQILNCPLSHDSVMPGKRTTTGVKNRVTGNTVCDYLSLHVPTSTVCVHTQPTVARSSSHFRGIFWRLPDFFSQQTLSYFPLLTPQVW